MVRFTILTCVFGMAAFCFAVIIHASSTYAQSRRTCPCWEQGLDDLLGKPADLGPVTDIHCDTHRTPDINPQFPTSKFYYIAIDGNTLVRVDENKPQEHIPSTCENNVSGPNLSNLTWPDTQTCVFDIFE